MARPKRQFSDEEVQKIAEYALTNCNTLTIANALDIPFNTLTRRFGKLLKQKRAEHRATLRQYQYNLAKDNSQMAQFLGKNELNQTDKQTIAHEGATPAISEEVRQAVSGDASKLKRKLSQVIPFKEA